MKGVHAVYTTKVADDLAIEEASEEFISRFEENKLLKSASLPIMTSACPGETCSIQCRYRMIPNFRSGTKIEISFVLRLDMLCGENPCICLTIGQSSQIAATKYGFTD